MPASIKCLEMRFGARILEKSHDMVQVSLANDQHLGRPRVRIL